MGKDWSNSYIWPEPGVTLAMIWEAKKFELSAGLVLGLVGHAPVSRPSPVIYIQASGQAKSSLWCSILSFLSILAGCQLVWWIIKA